MAAPTLAAACAGALEGVEAIIAATSALNPVGAGDVVAAGALTVFVAAETCRATLVWLGLTGCVTFGEMAAFAAAVDNWLAKD